MDHSLQRQLEYRIIRILSRCSRIEKVELIYDVVGLDPEGIETITKALQGTDIIELAVTKLQCIEQLTT